MGALLNKARMFFASPPAHVAGRELRSGLRHFKVFIACLVLGVGVITSVGTVSKSVKQGVKDQARGLLGGDVEIVYTNYLAPENQMAYLKERGAVSMIIEMRAMAKFGDQSQLTELKAVQPTYPLVGKFAIAPPITLEQALSNNGAVAEEAFYLQTGLQIGDTIQVGSQTLILNAKVTAESDRVASTFSLGPRVMISEETAKNTGLLLPGSLLRYRYRVLLEHASDAPDFIRDFKETFPSEPWQINTATEGDLAITQFMGRLEIFLTLAGLATLLIGGVGITSSVKTYLDRKSRTIAILKTMGATREMVFMSFFLIITAIGAIGSLLGVIAGLTACATILPMVSHLLPIRPEFEIFTAPILMGFWFGMITSYTFSVSTIGRAIEVKPATLFRSVDVIRRYKLPKDKLKLNLILLGVLILSLLITSSDTTIAAGFVVMALVSYALFMTCSNLVKLVARHIHIRYNPWLRLAVTNIHRVGSSTTATILSVGIALTVLIALALVENNFQLRIKNKIPEAAPSIFFIDIQPYQKGEFLNFLHSQDGAQRIMTQPMIRGRITHVKGTPVAELDVADSDEWVLHGDRGISYSSYAPENAVIEEGTWWDANYKGTPLASIDRSIADGLDVEIGDVITLNILGQPVDIQVANIRKIDYSTFQINFSIIISRGALDDFPQTFIATVKLEGIEQETKLINQMAGQFPNISAVRIRESVKAVNDIIDNISQALRVIVAITIISGIIVLSGAMSATIRNRMYDTVIMKVVGARRNHIIKSFLSEFVILSMITACISSIMGILGAWLILSRLDDSDFIIRFDVIIITSLSCLCVVAAIGFAQNYRVFKVRASRFLRNE